MGTPATTARPNERDGALSVFASDLNTLDVSSAENGGKPPIQLTVVEQKVTPTFYYE